MQRRALTLLEVILSLAIFGGCVAALGELTRMALRNAREATDMTQAELLAESILARVRIGVIDMESVTDKPITDRLGQDEMISDTNAVAEGGGEALWLYSLEITDIDDYGLVELAITVRRNVPPEFRPVACRLVRWLALEPEKEEDTDPNTDESS